MARQHSVYVALVQVRPLQGCELSPTEFAGAFVRCYVAAKSLPSALDRIRATLALDAFEIVNIEWCVKSDSVDWENPDDETGTELEAEASATGEVVYGEFHGWEHDAPDAE